MVRGIDTNYADYRETFKQGTRQLTRLANKAVDAAMQQGSSFVEELGIDPSTPVRWERFELKTTRAAQNIQFGIGAKELATLTIPKNHTFTATIGDQPFDIKLTSDKGVMLHNARSLTAGSSWITSIIDFLFRARFKQIERCDDKLIVSGRACFLGLLPLWKLTRKVELANMAEFHSSMLAETPFATLQKNFADNSSTRAVGKVGDRRWVMTGDRIVDFDMTSPSKGSTNCDFKVAVSLDDAPLLGARVRANTVAEPLCKYSIHFEAELAAHGNKGFCRGKAQIDAFSPRSSFKCDVSGEGFGGTKWQCSEKDVKAAWEAMATEGQGMRRAEGETHHQAAGAAANADSDEFVEVQA